jgi:rod shape-determining protein MreD
MKKNFIYIIIILVAIILQTSVFPIIFDINSAGDVVLMAILALSVIDGFSAFLGWAITAGILYDLATYATIGEHVLVFLLVVYFVSFFSRRFPTDLKGIGLILFIIFVVIATFISRGIFALVAAWDLQTLQGYGEAFGSFRFIALGVIYNEILFFIWFIALKKIKKFFDI